MLKGTCTHSFLMLSFSCLTFRHEACVVDSGSSARATQLFPFVSTTTRCLSLSWSVAAAGGGNLPPLMMPLRDDQYISLSPTDSPAGMPKWIQVQRHMVKLHKRKVSKWERALPDLPAKTPRTPGPKRVNFQQFCDQLRTNLPGDSQGRGSFDTRTRFVAGDPGARFGSAPPLEIRLLVLVRSDIFTGSWSLNMSCGSVDIWRNFTLFMSWWITEIWQTISDRTPPCPTGRQQQDGGTVASSSLVLTRRKRNYYSSPFPHLRGCIMCTPPGLAPLFWRPWWLCFLGSTSYCWTVIAYRLLCLKLKTCGLRPTWRVFQPIVRVAFLRHTLSRFSKDPQVVYTQSRVCSTRMGQGALVVSEPHAEPNAGLIVIFRSSHPPLFGWNAWSLRLRSSPGSITEDEFKEEASNLAFAFWDRIGEFLKRSRTCSELS